MRKLSDVKKPSLWVCRVGRTKHDGWMDMEGKGKGRSEEHTSELQSLMRISYAVFCLKRKNKKTETIRPTHSNYQVHITDPKNIASQPPISTHNITQDSKQ